MTDLAFEISEDYDHDVSDKDMDRDYAQIDLFDKELTQLIGVTQSIHLFGMNPSTHVVLKSTGLLSGTALESLGLESFANSHEGCESSNLATEALIGKVTAKIAEWSARILSFTKNMAGKVLDGLSSLWSGISDQAKKLTSSVWDKTKAAGRTIKAHPFKTVAAVVAAAAAVAVIVGLMTTGSYANENALQSFLYKVQDKLRAIRWPFARIDANIVEGKKIVTGWKTTELAKETVKVSQSGWTQETVKTVMTQLSRIWSTLKSGITAAGNKILAGVKVVDSFGKDNGAKIKDFVADKTKSKLAGWASQKVIEKVYMTALWSVVGVLYNLLQKIVIKAFSVVKETFNSLRGMEAQSA